MKTQTWIVVIVISVAASASGSWAFGQAPKYGMSDELPPVVSSDELSAVISPDEVPRVARSNDIATGDDTPCGTGCDKSCKSVCDSVCDECDAGCTSCKSRSCKSGWCNLGEPFALLGEHPSGVTAGGWLQLGYTNYDTGQFNNHPYGVDLHQAYAYVEKAADGSCGWDWGFRFDYVYGVDGPDTQAFGNPPNSWDFGWNAGGFYGHAIPQLYGELAYNDWSVKVGHFYTIIGYEVVTAPDNFFYSHAFTMYNGEPFTHTGILVNRKLNDDVEVWGGWTPGWDTGFDKFGGDIFLGGISAVLTEDVTATYAVTTGNIGFGSNASGYSHSFVVDVALADNLQYVFQNDWTEYGPQVDAVGINQYLIYTINDCLSTGVRFEWWQGEDATGNRADLYEFTYGINVRPNANLVFRPEIRWDRDDDGIVIPADHNDRLGFGIDAILTF